MNNWKEPYPTDMDKAFKEVNKIAIELKAKLNDTECPILKDLFLLRNNKRYREDDQFQKLGYSPNKGKSFMGLYCFGEIENNIITPVYVGISRNVLERLRQHTWGKVKSHCTLAYLMNRKEINDHPNSKLDYFLEKGKKKIRPFKVAIYPVENDYDLAFYEIAIAGILQTKWNTFRTH